MTYYLLLHSKLPQKLQLKTIHSYLTVSVGQEPGHALDGCLSSGSLTRPPSPQGSTGKDPLRFLAHSWMLAGFSSSWAVILSSRPQSLGSLPRGPLHRACHSMAAYFIRLGNWEDESTSQTAVTVFFNLMTEVTSHDFCWILSVTSKSQGPAYQPISKGRGLQKGVNRHDPWGPHQVNTTNTE